MRKYRIVQLFHDSESTGRKIEWVIEQKKLWGWREIFHVEGHISKRISHQSYDDAEQYLFDNYTKNGICKRHGSTYTFDKYTLWLYPR